MERSSQICLVLIVLLGAGLFYVAGQLNSLQERVNELDFLIIESGVRIDNGTDATTKTVHLTRGATALEALQRTTTVETKVYPGMGTFIVSINGIVKDDDAGTYWLVGRRKGDLWKALSIGVDSFELDDGDNLLFWYGKPSESPFESPTGA